MEMDSRQLSPEKIFPGLLYLAALVLWTLRLLQGEPWSTVWLWKKEFNCLQPGQLALLSALIVAGSWIMGALMGRIVADIFDLVRQEIAPAHAGFSQKVTKKWKCVNCIVSRTLGWVDKAEQDDVDLVNHVLHADFGSLGKNLEARYVAKSFFRSMVVAIPLLYFAAWLWEWGCATGLNITLLFAVIWELFFAAFKTQRVSHLSLFHAMKDATLNVKPRGETDRGG